MNLLFSKPETNLWFLFFIFFKNVSWIEWESWVKGVVFFGLRSCYFSWSSSGFLKKFKRKPHALLGLFFWGCQNVIMNGEFWIMNLVVVKKGGIFKKQCKPIPSALAAAQSKGILFLFVYWDFLIAFTNSWYQIVV